MRSTRGYLDMPWGQLHYRTAAAAPELPLLIMLHQSPLSSRNYAAVLPLLAAGCRPVALDTPGFGQSDPSPDWEVGDYAAMVWAVADALGVQTAHVFGRATGGVFALEAALSRPERTQSLILHGVPIYTDAERVDRLANFAPPYPLADDGGHLQWIWARIHSEYPWIDAALATQFMREFLDAGPDFATSYRSMWRYDLRARVAAASLPARTLLLGGSRDRIAYMQARAEALMPGAEALVLEGATDFVAQQEPQRFADCVLGFLNPSPQRGEGG